MNLVLIYIGLISIIGLCQVFAATSEVENLRSHANELEAQLVSLNWNQADIRSFRKCIDKIVKAVEEKNCSSKSSITIGELKEKLQKYSKKLTGLVEACSYIDPVQQLESIQLIQDWLSEVDINSVLGHKISLYDDHFIENLRTLPPGTIGAHYTEMWNSINALEAQNLPHNEFLMFLDSAVVNFTAQFTTSVCRDFDGIINDTEASRCLFAPHSETYNRALEKISALLPNEDIAS